MRRRVSNKSAKRTEIYYSSLALDFAACSYTYSQHVILVTPKHGGGAAATAGAAWPGLPATASAPVALSSQHAATVPDAVVASSAAVPGTATCDSDALHMVDPNLQFNLTLPALQGLTVAQLQDILQAADNLPNPYESLKAKLIRQHSSTCWSSSTGLSMPRSWADSRLPS